MLPIFPNFKPLQIGDKNDIEAVTKKFLPYSDFNFMSMWSWDVDEQMKVCKLGDNLVIQFTDYLTGTPFLSFLGKDSVNDTIESLLTFSKKIGISPRLKLVPEESVKNVDKAKIIIEPDRDDFDYLYKISDQVRMEGGKWEIKRKHCRYFEKNNNFQLRQLNLNDEKVKKDITKLFNNWSSDKGTKVPKRYFIKEFAALNRFLDAANETSIFSLGIYINDDLVAAAITESLPNGFSLSHFQKARTGMYKGLNVFLNKQVADLLRSKNVEFINVEQDLGIPGLRESKESYLPELFLKKYYLSAVH